MTPLRRVWFVSLWFPPPMEGGSLVYTFNLASHLPGPVVHVLSSAAVGSRQFDSGQPYAINRCWVSGMGAGKFRRVAVTASWLVMSVRAILRRPQVIVAADITAASQTAMLLARLLRVPYVGLIYAEELTTLVNCNSRLWNRRLDKWLRIRSLQGASGFVSVSDFALEQLGHLGIRATRTAKIVPMVTCPVRATAKEVSDTRAKWSIAEGAEVVLSVGRLIERKGHDRLLDAWPRVKAGHPNAHLVIVGRGEREQLLRKRAAELAVGDSVVFAGFVPDSELHCYYEMCQMLVMPHRALSNGDTEGCPTVFLEANAYGKPVVGGDAGGVRDAIIDEVTGLIVDGNNPDAIARAICRLLADPAHAGRLGENGQRRVREELSPRQGGAQLYEFLQSVVDETACGS